MASLPILNPSVSNPERSRKKKKKKAPVSDSKNSKWRSEAQKQIYSSKLLQALTQVSDAPPRGRAVREAADKALAVAARGRTRWSRAILTSRLKLKFRKQKKPKPAATGNGTGRSSAARKVSVLRLRGKSQPAVQRKARVLGRLVPGCRKEALPVILEEATDYIAALEMQVRAMSELADLLSRAASTSSPATTTTT